MIDYADDPRGVQLRLLMARAQYDRHVAAEVDRILLDTFTSVSETILSPTFRDLSAFDRTRTLQLFAEVNARLAGGYQQLTTATLNELAGYAGIEGQVARAQLAGALATGSEQLGATLGAFLPDTLTSSIATLGGAAVGSLTVHGYTLPDWYQAQLQTMTQAVRTTIQQGLVQGLPTREIAAGIVPPRSSTDPAAYLRARRDATAITRTVTTAVHNSAAQASYQAAGPSITQRYRFVAVRDSRTTPICRATDGKVFAYDDPDRKVPPLHFGCRSTTIPVIDGSLAAQLGLDSANDPAHSMPSYDAWLRGETQATQNSILGPSRAALWRSGSMTLASAIDQDGRTLTLTQLRETVAAAPLPTPVP